MLRKSMGNETSQTYDIAAKEVETRLMAVFCKRSADPQCNTLPKMNVEKPIELETEGSAVAVLQARGASWQTLTFDKVYPKEMEKGDVEDVVMLGENHEAFTHDTSISTNTSMMNYTSMMNKTQSSWNCKNNMVDAELWCEVDLIIKECVDYQKKCTQAALAWKWIQNRQSSHKRVTGKMICSVKKVLLKAEDASSETKKSETEAQSLWGTRFETALETGNLASLFDACKKTSAAKTCADSDKMNRFVQENKDELQILEQVDAIKSTVAVMVV